MSLTVIVYKQVVVTMFKLKNQKHYHSKHDLNNTTIKTDTKAKRKSTGIICKDLEMDWKITDEVKIKVTCDGQTSKKIPLENLINVELLENCTTRCKKIRMLKTALDTFKLDMKGLDSDIGEISDDSCEILDNLIMDWATSDTSMKSKWKHSKMSKRNNTSELPAVVVKRPIRNKKPAPVSPIHNDCYWEIPEQYKSPKLKVAGTNHPKRNKKPAGISSIDIMKEQTEGKKEPKLKLSGISMENTPDLKAVGKAEGKTELKLELSGISMENTPELEAVNVKSSKRNRKPACLSPIKNGYWEIPIMHTPKLEVVVCRRSPRIRKSPPVSSLNNSAFKISPNCSRKNEDEDTKSTITRGVNARSIMELYQKKEYFKLLDVAFNCYFWDLQFLEETKSLTEMIDGVEVGFINLGPSCATLTLKNDTGNLFFSVCKGSGIVNTLEKRLNIENGTKIMIPAGAVYNIENISCSSLWMLVVKSPDADLTNTDYTLRRSSIHT